MLTLEQLIAIVPRTPVLRLSLFLPHLVEDMPAFGITTLERQAQFLATCGHESAGFCHTTELWGPTPAQARYEGREDLGNAEPGDGYRFRGRGLIQITGRANYASVSKALGHDYIGRPEDMARIPDAVRVSCWMWDHMGCNELADIGGLSGFDRVTRRVNGGHNGWNDRVGYYMRAMDALRPSFANVQSGSATTAPPRESEI